MVLDSNAVSGLTGPATSLVRAHLVTLHARWDVTLVVPAVVLAECLRGDARDARTDRLLKACVVPAADAALARRAASLRTKVASASAIDALVVAHAEALPGPVITVSADPDIGLLVAHAEGKVIHLSA